VSRKRAFGRAHTISWSMIDRGGVFLVSCAELSALDPESRFGLFIELMAKYHSSRRPMGDEGKGKIIDVLTEEADLVVRTQGGNNAGHTVHIKGRSTSCIWCRRILRKNKVCVIGNGVVVDPVALFQGDRGLRKLGIRIDKNLYLSETAHLVLPYIANWMPSGRH